MIAPPAYPQGAVADLVYWPERDSVLMLRKVDHKFEGGKWGLPGGKQEYGETSLRAACRELAEECGPDMNENNLVHRGVIGILDDIEYPIGKHYITALHLFLVRNGQKPDARNSEPHNHAEVCWFDIFRLPPEQTNAFRRVRHTIWDWPWHAKQGSDLLIRLARMSCGV